MYLESERLILRSYEDSDASDLVEGLNNIEVAKWMAGVPFPYTEEDAKYFISKSKNNDENVKISLAIVLKDNNKVIGGTEITNINTNLYRFVGCNSDVIFLLMKKKSARKNNFILLSMEK